jgi:hypothetical protein
MILCTVEMCNRACLHKVMTADSRILIKQNNRATEDRADHCERRPKQDASGEPSRLSQDGRLFVHGRPDELRAQIWRLRSREIEAGSGVVRISPFSERGHSCPHNA